MFVSVHRKQYFRSAQHCGKCISKISQLKLHIAQSKCLAWNLGNNKSLFSFSFSVDKNFELNNDKM